MNSSRALFSVLRQIKIGANCKSKARNSVVLYASSKNYSTETEHTQTQELVFKEKIQIGRPEVTKWKRPPFAKNFFFGKFDTELLAFPEVLNDESLLEVEKYVKLLNELYIEKVNSRQIDETGKIPDDFLQDLKDLGLFGRMIPAKYGGLDLSYTACTRLNEVIGLDWSVYSLLTAHEFFASRVILGFGSEEQKNKYLPLLASGKMIGAFCASELECGSELISISTTAKECSDSTFMINGSKCWVTNAEIADLFIVFAKTQNPVDPQSTDTSVFLADARSEGISITPHEKICLKGVKTSMVTFKEVVIPKENLIGQWGHGTGIFLKTMEDFRIAMNSFTFGTLKILFDSLTDRIINSERLEQSLGDLHLVRQRLAKITSMIYAMESTAYFTAAIQDTSENPDVRMESVIMKIFNSEGTLYCIRELMELLGSTSLMKEQHLERFHRDALGLQMFDGPNDLARLLLGLSGCQAVGNKKAEHIRKMRNPFFFPMHTVKIFMKKYRHSYERIKYDQDLAGYIHPSLVEWGNLLEANLQKFEIAVEHVLSEHGSKLTQTQLDLKVLADAAVDMYAQAAVLSRASRSYCIGLKNANQEVRLAGAFCYDSSQRLELMLMHLALGVYKKNDSIHLCLGDQVIHSRGYFPEHPLKHNF